MAHPFWDKYWKENYNLTAPTEDGIEKKEVPAYVNFFSHAIPFLIGCIVVGFLVIFIGCMIYALIATVL